MLTANLLVDVHWPLARFVRLADQVGAKVLAWVEGETLGGKEQRLLLPTYVSIFPRESASLG